MKLQIAANFDQKLAELYSSKVTVNLDNRESTIDPNKFWNSMELIAVNHKAMINYRLK
jgi:viroplasmin and RNaseH domain-containing protein